MSITKSLSAQQIDTISGDANGDGNITVTDIGVIVDIILGNNANTRVSNMLEPQ